MNYGNDNFNKITYNNMYNLTYCYIKIYNLNIRQTIYVKFKLGNIEHET